MTVTILLSKDETSQLLFSGSTALRTLMEEFHLEVDHTRDRYGDIAIELETVKPEPTITEPLNTVPETAKGAAE